MLRLLKSLGGSRADQSTAVGVCLHRAMAVAAVPPSGRGVKGCRASVTQQVDENGTLYDVFAVTADARHGAYGSPDFVRRSRRARLANR